MNWPNPAEYDIWCNNNVIVISKRRRNLTSGANGHSEAWTNDWQFAWYFETHFLGRNFLYSLKCILMVLTDTWFRKWFGANQVTGPYLNQCWPRSALRCDIIMSQLSYNRFFSLWWEQGHKVWNSNGFDQTIFCRASKFVSTTSNGYFRLI